MQFLFTRILRLSPDRITAPWLTVDYCYRGVSLFALARKTGKRRYLRLAKKCLSRIKGWCQQGCINAMHFERLLQAELSVCKGKKEAAKNYFELASVLASRGGFIQDYAFVNERFGEFLLNDMNDSENATFVLKEAVKLFDEWGAHAKADQLRRKHEQLLARSNYNPAPVTVSTTYTTVSPIQIDAS